MSVWLALPILGTLVILQSVVVNRFTMLNGFADAIMLVVIAWTLQKNVRGFWYWAVIGGLLVGFVSALPLGVPLIIYIIVVGLALVIKQRVLQIPILAMFVTTFIGTLLANSIILIALRIYGTVLPLQEVIFTIILPSILLNLILAIPAYALMTELASWIYPEELAA